jgi:hypothetical protein
MNVFPRKKNLRRRGTATVLAVTATLPLMAAAGTLLMVTVHHRSEAEESAIVTAARDAAASGAQDAMAKLTTDPNYTGTYDLNVGSGTAHVVVSDWTNDGVDNDGNGKIDDAAEANYIGIASEGRINFDANGRGSAYAVQTELKSAGVVVKKTKLDIVANTAFYVDDPFAAFNFNGTAFLINGNDTNLDGTKGPNPAIPGIGTPGNPTGIVSQLSAKQKPDVTGFGGSPSVSKVTADDINAQMSAIAPLATLTWSGADEHLSNAVIGDLKNQKAQIAHAKGNLFLSGGTKGCGILVVDGNLEVTGNFDFAGVVFVSGSVTFKGGGGAKNIRGALFTPGNVQGDDVNVSGSIQIGYSSQALDIVNTQLSAGVQLISWTQK